jgi:hypothetical protein
MKDIIHPHNRIIKSTFLEQVLHEHDFDFVEVWLCGFCGLYLLGCCRATYYGSYLVAGFECRDEGAEA